MKGIYIGQDVVKRLWDRIKRAERRIVIISPWISRHYLLKMENLRRSIDKKVLILPDERNISSLSSVYPKRVSMWGFVSLVSAMVGAALIIHNALLSLPFLLVSILSSLRFWVLHLPPHIRTMENLHAKIYIVDDALLLSSANLTSSNYYEFLIEVSLNDDTLKKIEELWRRGSKPRIYTPLVSFK